MTRTLPKDKSAQPVIKMNDPRAALLDYVYFYDQRCVRAETEIREDKQGLATRKRNK